MMRVRHASAWPMRLVVLVLAAACAGAPAPIEYGAAECDYCRMEISDPRYGAQVITSTGKTHEFDSIECAASFAATMEPGRIRSVFVSDFLHPGTMLRAEDAKFHRDVRRSGPMGGGLLAVASDTASATLDLDTPTEPMTWVRVLDLAAAGDLQPAAIKQNTGAPDAM